MTDEIFVDTGAWLALVDKDDQHHIAAQRTFSILLRSGSRLVTTNLVVAETYTLIRRRIDYRPAMEFLRNVRSSPRLERIYSGFDIELRAEILLERYMDQDFSFVVMRERQLTKAFAFDHHFR